MRRALGHVDVGRQVGSIFPSRQLHEHERHLPPNTPLPHIPGIVACMCCCILQRVDVPDDLRRGAGSGECDSSLLLYSIDDSGQEKQPRIPGDFTFTLVYCPASAGSRDEMKMSLI